jgi:hypothetical protein
VGLDRKLLGGGSTVYTDFLDLTTWSQISAHASVLCIRTREPRAKLTFLLNWMFMLHAQAGQEHASLFNTDSFD